MKVHPHPQPPQKKRNITLRYDTIQSTTKKLRRLPHIFAKVLELPFRSETDVSVTETDTSLIFTVSDTDVSLPPSSHVSASTIEIHPGVTKIVVVVPSENDIVSSSVTEFELDLWRFRLPESTRPELATAECRGGDLVVVVPKGEERERSGGWGDGNNSSNSSSLVLVQ